jgi:hypothetical protein
VPAGLHKGNSRTGRGFGEIITEGIHLLLAYRWVKQQGNKVINLHSHWDVSVANLILITRL